MGWNFNMIELKCDDSIQNTDVRLELNQVQGLWAGLQSSLEAAVLSTVKTQQVLQYHCSPQLSLQAHQDLHHRLQVVITQHALSPQLFVNVVVSPSGCVLPCLGSPRGERGLRRGLGAPEPDSVVPQREGQSFCCGAPLRAAEQTEN